ncbi:hypothetical protein BV898_10334 [Hypsibius exemplaris]|uniref:Uncharacterized protein n=1 Tax=Hypsibius exemplaris TaxID=2072580 RepID=A0A1W0WJV6_HYPEX|nr:hypothetical protein BV898_10334 [Hypsibius exemplaris]
MLHWHTTFLGIRNADRDETAFDHRAAEFSSALVDLVLPGPKHPARDSTVNEEKRKIPAIEKADSPQIKTSPSIQNAMTAADARTVEQNTSRRWCNTGTTTSVAGQ